MTLYGIFHPESWENPQQRVVNTVHIQVQCPKLLDLYLKPRCIWIFSAKRDKNKLENHSLENRKTSRDPWLIHM